jgi:hypothetical protein
MKKKKIIYTLMINEKPVVTIDGSNINLKVAGENDDEVPIEEYLKTTIQSEMDYDGVFGVCSYYWKKDKK